MVGGLAPLAPMQLRASPRPRPKLPPQKNIFPLQKSPPSHYKIPKIL